MIFTKKVGNNYFLNINSATNEQELKASTHNMTRGMLNKLGHLEDAEKMLGIDLILYIMIKEYGIIVHKDGQGCSDEIFEVEPQYIRIDKSTKELVILYQNFEDMTYDVEDCRVKISDLDQTWYIRTDPDVALNAD